MSIKDVAMFLVTAKGLRNSTSVGATSASDALRKRQAFMREGFSTLVFDSAGRERSVSELETMAEEEVRPKT